jgi:putative nucleotidyltransferase with HDIG domain
MTARMTARLTLDQVKAAVQQLPALPAVVLKVLQTFRQENPDVDLLAREIAHDQALATRVLRLANSPFYGLQTKVGSLHDAITVLGFRNVRSAVAAIAVMRCFAQSPVAGFDFNAFQGHATAVALAARAIARQAQLPEELAFSAGLVHDIGVLALLTAFPEEMAAVLAYATRHDCALREAEREVLGLDHASVGDNLLRHWHFPEEICRAVLGHHDSSAIGGLADVIHVADVVVHGLAAAEHAGGRVPPLSDIAFNRLDLSVDKLKQVMAEVMRDFEPVRQALSI